MIFNDIQQLCPLRVQVGMEMVLEKMKQIQAIQDEMFNNFINSKHDLVMARRDLDETAHSLNLTQTELMETNTKLGATEANLNETSNSLDLTKTKLTETINNFSVTAANLNVTSIQLGNTKNELKSTKVELSSTKALLNNIVLELSSVKNLFSNLNESVAIEAVSRFHDHEYLYSRKTTHDVAQAEINCRLASAIVISFVL